MGRGPKPAKGNARPAVPRKSRKNGDSEVRDLEKRLAETLAQLQTREGELAEAREQATAAQGRADASQEQQAATAEILRVMRQSPIEIQPVFSAIAESAVRLTGAVVATVYEFDGSLVHLRGWAAPPDYPYMDYFRRQFPRAPAREFAAGWVILERALLHRADLQNDPNTPELTREWARQMDLRSVLWVPMLREGEPIGVIGAVRREAGIFSDDEVRLLQTFADQAVVAIENVRLFTELQEKNRALSESLEQQTATSEVLRVISSSPTDVQPVFDAIVGSAVRLCGGLWGTLYRRYDDMVDSVASWNVPAEVRDALRHGFPRPVGTGASPHFHRALVEGMVATIRNVETDPELSPRMRAFCRQHELRSVVMVPLRGRREILGALVAGHRQVEAFSDSHMSLLQTFADQAVIAIENARLFKELQEKNQALTVAHAQVTESLEQQTATGEILRVISSSPTDVQPVFETIAQAATTLCEADLCHLYRFDGDLIHFAAEHGGTPAETTAAQRAFPQAPSRLSVTARAILRAAIVQVADVSEEPEVADSLRMFRTVLSVPMLRDRRPLGAITVARRLVRPFTDKQIELLQTFADQAVIAIENVRLFTALQASNRELSTALDKQTATSDILRVISRSQTDIQPVFDAIVASAVRLLEADSGLLTRIAGDQIEIAALTSTDPAGDAILRAAYPLSRHSDRVHARVIRDRAPLNVADAQTDPRLPDVQHATARARGYRSHVAVPLLRHDEALGAIAVTRHAPGGFTDDEIALLQTFADQAVIAIENARLLSELQEKNASLTQALDQQTATSEILRVISSSPTDAQPVFDSIAASALRLCEAKLCTVFRFDGTLIHFVAGHHVATEGAAAYRDVYPAPPGRAGGTHRAILTRRIVHIPDIREDPEYELTALARANDFGCVLAVPMFRDGRPIGAITVGREAGRGFADEQIELLKTFADQAVIAIENVRLFTELQTSNSELTTALDTQTATSDILRVISGSRTDVQPVFDAILISALRLLRAYSGTLTRLVGEQIEIAAISSTSPEGDTALRTRFPQPLDSAGPHARTIRDRAPLNVADTHTDQRLPNGFHAYARVRGYRSQVVVPMLHYGEAVGTISVTRREPGGFTDDEIALLKTFADQAVIAIENARLMSELQARTDDLSRSVGELRALSEIGQAIGSTLDLQTVLAAIVARATELAGADAGAIYEYDVQREVFEPRASERLEGEIVQELVATPIRKGQGVTGRLAEVLAPIQTADITVGERILVRELLVRAGYRALLAVPLVREGVLIGGLTVFRKTPGEYAANVVELMQTFATQSALAIQNARLFREIEIKSRQLEVASQHKSEFLANMSHELRTPLNAIIGFSEVLSERMFGELNEKQDEYLKDIHASAQHLLSLINDILDLSKIEAGRMELELTDFDLPVVIDNALVLVRERAARRGIELHRTVDEQLGQIQGDERKIRQVLLNLLSNAMKFTPEGGRIEVGAKPVNRSIEVSVSDTGVGIAPEDQEAVFEEFRQVGTADKKVEGTGLGLALSRKFIELHGGRIWVKSQVGVGATFTFTVPVRRGE